MYSLKLMTADFAGRQVELTDDEVVLGRSSSCTIQLDDNIVSKQHVKLTKGQHGYQLHDLGSANGVKLNGRRLAQPQALKNGDSFRIGKFLIMYKAPAISSPEKATPAPTKAKETPGQAPVAADIAAKVPAVLPEKAKDAPQPETSPEKAKSEKPEASPEKSKDAPRPEASPEKAKSEKPEASPESAKEKVEAKASDTGLSLKIPMPALPVPGTSTTVTSSP